MDWKAKAQAQFKERRSPDALLEVPVPEWGISVYYWPDLTLAIEVVSRDSARLDDRLDVLCANVENAIGADPTLAGMVKDCALTDTVVTHSFDGDAPIGSARMQFRIMYRTSELDAGSIID